jgi:hypothetical protein
MAATCRHASNPLGVILCLTGSYEHHEPLTANDLFRLFMGCPVSISEIEQAKSLIFVCMGLWLNFKNTISRGATALRQSIRPEALGMAPRYKCRR